MVNWSGVLDISFTKVNMRYTVNYKQVAITLLAIFGFLSMLTMIDFPFSLFQGNPANLQMFRFYDDVTTDVVITDPPQESFEEEELIPIEKLNLPTETYKFHPLCNCSR